MMTTRPGKNKLIVSVLLISFLLSFLVAVPALASDDEPAENPFLYGDVNNDGKIDIADAILILRHIVDLVKLEKEDYEYAQYAAEVSANNEIDVFDAIFLLRRVVGLIEEGDFPAEIRLADAEKIVVKAIESESSDLDLELIREALEILLPPIPPRDDLESCIDILEAIMAAEASESLEEVADMQALIDELPDGEAKAALQARLDDLKVEIEGIFVEGEPFAGETLIAIPTPEEATGDYQWLRADSEDGEYEEIAGATDGIYTLTEDDVGSFIKVTIDGTGAYKGTATSEAIGPVEEADPEAAKIAFIEAFNAIIEEIRVDGDLVATANMTYDEDIGVLFVTDNAGDIYAGAGVVVNALRDLAGDGSTIKIEGGDEFTLDDDLDISALAQAILGDGGVEGFLDEGVLTVTYEASVLFLGDLPLELSGDLIFMLEKAVFIGAFNAIIEEIRVDGDLVATANMTYDEDIGVLFVTDNAGEIKAGAGVVVNALRDLAGDGSTITINEETFTLDDDLDISALAQAILGDGGVEGFLENGVLSVEYVATVYYVGDDPLEFSGNLTFMLEKAAFIEAFNAIIEEIEVEDELVATANMAYDEDIEVIFVTDNAGDIYAGAGVVVNALRDLAGDGSTITINEETFTLDDDLDISALAHAILGDGGVEDFLDEGELTVTYEASVLFLGDLPLELSGDLTFMLELDNNHEDETQ